MISPSLISSPAYANPLCAIATVGICSAIVIWQTEKFGSELRGVKSDIKDFERRLTNCIQRVEERLEGVEERLEGVEGRLQNVEGRLQNVEEKLEGVEGDILGVDSRLRTGTQLFHDTVATGDGTTVVVGGQAHATNQGTGNVPEPVAPESGDSASNGASPNPQND